ncbi:MAG: TenA family protein [Alphaproteobacteria bacterium]|nr:TenA family protein [Alphaproteobacteria bacterium]
MTGRDVSFSEELRERHADAWAAATDNRFVRELVADEIDDAVYARYLRLDYAFIETLTAAVGHAVACAPGMAAKSRFAGFLGVLTSEENDYFLRSFDAFGAPPPSFDNPVSHPVVDGFAGLMARQRAAGTYLDILTVLVPVEWVYLQWASDAVAGNRPMPERFYLSEWITLHAEPAFSDFVTWMRAELDREADRADPDVRARAEVAFVEALKLESAFFAASYEPE